MRGILKGDSDDGYVIDAKGNKAKVPRGSSDAALSPYHVDRSKLFVMDRFAKVKSLDATRIANAIEFTRFPSAPSVSDSDSEEGMLVRAADLIGQLGDPHYLSKTNALYYEFEEVGMEIGNSAILRPPTSPTCIQSFIGTTWRRTSEPQSVISTLRRADGSGSLIFTAMSLARNASLT